MREVTNLMIDEYNIRKLGYDFMGFRFKEVNELSFHHLIIPHRDCNNVEDEGYIKWNGAILVRNTSHEYLHLIETYERERFNEITQIMIQINRSGQIDQDSLLNIEYLLRGFESQYKGQKSKKGHKLIKDIYYNRVYR